MDSLGTTKYLLVWQHAEQPLDDQGLLHFDSPPKIPRTRWTHLTNLLGSAPLWQIDASGAMTMKASTGKAVAGQLARPDMFVCGFFVIRGSVKKTMQLASQIDWSFMQNYDLDDEAREALEAHSTMTFAPLVGVDATAMVVWANAPDDKPPTVPMDLVLDIITSIRTWVRQLGDEGHLLDTGRVNVRFDTSHLQGGEVTPGRKTGGRLLGIGTIDVSEVTLEEAVAESGLDSEETTYDFARENVLACAQGPDNCIAAAAAARPPTLDDPRESLFP